MRILNTPSCHFFSSSFPSFLVNRSLLLSKPTTRILFLSRLFSGQQIVPDLNVNFMRNKKFYQRSIMDHRVSRFFSTKHLGDHMRIIEDPICQTKSYTGVEAEFYDLLRGEAPEEEINFYRNLIQEKGGSALELGSGTGRLLLPLLKTGLKIEGLEASKEMLEICRNQAIEKNLKPVLYLHEMQNFQIPKKYETIFIEGGSFMLLTNRDDAFLTLENIQRHLKPGGQAIIELFLPMEDIKKNSSSWDLHKTSTRTTDNAHVFCSGASKCDVLEQVRTGWTKYEVFKNGHLLQSQLVISGLRWYSKYEFWLMLEKVGFKEIEMINIKMRKGADEETTMVFKAVKGLE